MSKSIRLILIVLMLLSLLVLVPSGCNAEIVDLPLEGEGLPPQKDGFTDWTYEDPSISVRIERGRVYDTDYVIAYVKIATPTQLRTQPAYSYYSVQQLKIEEILDDIDNTYVIAMNGDWYNSEERLYCRYTCRQGKVFFVNNAVKDYEKDWWLDILVIDDQGDFHVEQRATKERLSNLPYTPINSFTFGPALVIDGVPQTVLWDMTGSTEFSNPAARTVIAQTGKLEYMLIYTCQAECADCAGLTIQQLGAFVSSLEGVQTAYTLDGGGSGQMIFHGRKISSPAANRDISDIIYFTSAYVPD